MRFNPQPETLAQAILILDASREVIQELSAETRRQWRYGVLFGWASAYAVWLIARILLNTQ